MNDLGFRADEFETLRTILPGAGTIEAHRRFIYGAKRDAGGIEIGRRGLGRISFIQGDSGSLKSIRTQKSPVDVIGIESAISEKSRKLQQGMRFSEVIQNRQ